jgi:hypothetical protein
VIAWLIGALAIVAAVGGAYWQGRQDGRDIELAEAARDEQVADIASRAAADAVAVGLSNLKVINRTIQNEVQRDVIEKPVYRDVACRHDADSLQRVNAALTGAYAAGPAGASQLPTTDAAARPVVRLDDAEAGRGGQPIPRVPTGGAATD